MRSGLRPIHSVDTITCTSEISGTASSGVRVIAQMPHTVRITVPVNTRNRLVAHQSMIRSIMTIAPSPDAGPGYFAVTHVSHLLFVAFSVQPPAAAWFRGAAPLVQ